MAPPGRSAYIIHTDYVDSPLYLSSSDTHTHSQVMNRGQVREFDRPNRLLQQPNSLFRRMVEQTGEVAARKLFEMAEEADLRRRASRKGSLL